MKNGKSHLMLIPAIGSVSFVVSQLIMKSNEVNILFGLSSDALAGIVVGLGFGVMIILLKQGVAKGKNHCK
ncbi:MAG: hypothetical protein COB35_00305 [Gammaproteobacteria bacterium]|nr:MAG: hypothetical protein COB35_00305 [Gammaproteobacteria bacterium]